MPGGIFETQLGGTSGPAERVLAPKSTLSGRPAAQNRRVRCTTWTAAKSFVASMRSAIRERVHRRRRAPTQQRVLRAGGGRSRLGQGKEAEEAFDRRSVAFDLQIPGTQRLGELAVVVDQRGQGVRIGL